MGMNFCNNCGKQLQFGIPPGDDHERYHCGFCGTVVYQNPKMVVGSLTEHDGRILMCRRAIEPCYGLWTLPAGYLENNETATAGAIRETREEACAEIRSLKAYTLMSIGHISQIYLIFRARLSNTSYRPGAESLEVKLVAPDQIPWDDLAFRAIRATLELYVKDQARGQFGFHVGEIEPPAPLESNTT